MVVNFDGPRRLHIVDPESYMIYRDRFEHDARALFELASGRLTEQDGKVYRVRTVKRSSKGEKNKYVLLESRRKKGFIRDNWDEKANVEVHHHGLVQRTLAHVTASDNDVLESLDIAKGVLRLGRNYRFVIPKAKEGETTLRSHLYPLNRRGSL